MDTKTMNDQLCQAIKRIQELEGKIGELENLVTSEVADFFAGQEQPGEVIGAEAQHKELMARVRACFDGFTSCLTAKPAQVKQVTPLSPCKCGAYGVALLDLPHCHYVECSDCPAHTVGFETEEKAAAAWNKMQGGK